MTFQTHIKRLYSDVWYLGIHIEKAIAEQFLTNDANGKRVIAEINNLVKMHSALTSDGGGSYFLTINKENQKKLDVTEGSEVSVTLTKDVSKYGMEMPIELEELMAQDPDGDAIFHSLTPGKQRSLIFLVAKPKGAATRMKKAIVIIEYLKEVNGKLDYKELNQAFKDYNQYYK